MRIKQALARAVRLGLVIKNVADVLDTPKATTKEMTVWTLEQAQTFMAVADDTCSYGPIWTLALTLGMRRGELLGLQWQNVDLDRGVLRVRRTLTEINGKLIFGEPKTKAGQRDLDLRGATLTALRAHRAQQN